MKPLSIVTPLIALFASLNLSATPLSLFDGKTLNGWLGDSTYWSVQDGTITGQSTAEHPCNKTTYLTYTKGEFANFELTLSFRLIADKGNSGIQYRSQWHNKDAYQIKGYQADLETGPNYSGILYEQNGRGIVAKRGQHVVIATDGKKKISPLASGDKAQASIKRGEWNTYRVIANGNTLIHQINDHTTVKVEDNDPKRKAASGLIALQLHAGPPMKVQYKDIKVLKLPDSKATGSTPSTTPAPSWIWGDKLSNNQTLYFHKQFKLSSIPIEALLEASCDNRCTIWINEKKVAQVTDWKSPVRKNVASYLITGDNSIRVKARNVGSHAGLLLRIGNLLATDASWQVSKDKNNTHASPAKRIAVCGAEPWGDIFNVATAPENKPNNNIKTLAGFQVTQIHEVDNKTEGSWTAMCFDDQGNLYVCDQYGKLYRITLKDGKIATKQAVASPGYAQGLCWAFGSLYLNSYNRDAAGVHRLTDTNNDGSFDKSEHILPLKSAGEHGAHAIVKTADGKNLYVILGNHASATGSVTSVSGKNWAEDTLLPHLPDARGHARHIKAPGGTLIRFSPDGKERKIIATGMRNTYDIALSPTGDLFGYDSDMEYDIGTPWYRPTRILHYIKGAEYGWRNGTSKWPVYYADSLGSVTDVGPGSPTGVVFGTKAKFPLKYRKALFALDWTFGIIYAIHLKPDGTSYSGTKEPFISGKPLPLTDVAIGPDGAMYFLTGGRKLQSGLYRIDYTGSESTDDAISTTPTKAQENLRRIEASRDLDTIWPALASTDRTLRFAARVSLETQPVADWSSRYRDATDPQTVVTASIAMARCKGDRQLALDKLLAVDFAKLTTPQQIEYLRALSLVFIRLGAADDATKATWAGKLEPFYPSPDNMLNRELCRLLVYLDADSTVAKTTFLMQSSVSVKEDISPDVIKGNERYGKAFANMLKNQPDAQALHYALMLKNARVGWTPASVTAYYSWLNKAGSKSGGSSYQGFIENIRKEAIGKLPAELKAIAEKAPEYTPPTTPMPIAKGPGQMWTMESALAAVADLSKADAANGKQMYRATLCANCHTHSGSGGNSGPDLSNLGSRFSKKDILTAIIDPSEVISDQHNFSVIHLKDKSQVYGKVMKEDATHLYVASSAFDLSQQTAIKKSEVIKHTPSPLSPMPPALINSLNPAELRDLMRYLTGE